MSFGIRPVLLIAAAAGCGGRSASTAAEPGGAPPEQASRDRSIITQAELSDPGLKAQSLLSAIRSLRPQYLSVRGMQSYRCNGSADNCQADPEAGTVHVSVDNGRILPLQELENIHVATVREVRFLNQAAAMQKFGGSALSGPVILVMTVK